MSYQPNIEAARARFVERIANAYFQTWAGYGFMGPEYKFEKAVEIAEDLAKHAFPMPATPVLVKLDVDTAAVREALDAHRATFIHINPPAVLPAAPIDPDAPCGDGVVGD